MLFLYAKMLSVFTPLPLRLLAHLKKRKKNQKNKTYRSLFLIDLIKAPGLFKEIFSAIGLQCLHRDMYLPCLQNELLWEGSLAQLLNNAQFLCILDKMTWVERHTTESRKGLSLNQYLSYSSPALFLTITVSYD